MARTRKNTLRAVAACIPDMEADKPRQSQRLLYRKLQEAQRRWRSSRGKERDAAWAEMLKISKQMDEV